MKNNHNFKLISPKTNHIFLAYFVNENGVKETMKCLLCDVCFTVAMKRIENVSSRNLSSYLGGDIERSLSSCIL